MQCIILAFYGATDYENAFWSQPNLPFGLASVPPPSGGPVG